MKKKRTAPFLGALKLFWCDICNLPILDRHHCGICNSKTRKVNIAPPGDIRPAFDLDIIRISKIIDERFGPGSAKVLGLMKNRLVLLNGVSYDDLMDEIIIDGNIVGSLRYNLQLNDWEFYPRIIGAQRIFENSSEKRKFVQMDAGAVDYIAKGYNVLAPGVINIDKNLKKGEAAVAIGPDGAVLSTGTMRVDAKEVKSMNKGVVMKPKHSISDNPNEGIGNIFAANQTWVHAVKANEKTIANYEQKAIESIQITTKNNHDLPLSVSFSGGKDSLVCLQLARKTPGIDFKVLFVNTSLEFPETISYIEDVIHKFDLDTRFCRLDIPKEKFWTSVEKYGPPGKDYRYCCKILKIGPVNELIQNCVGKKTLSLVGQRAYESITRSESKTLWSNPWIPNQLNFTPIQNWTALHVWLYIMQEDLPINPLYKEGFSRIGCWLCPACNQGTFEIIKETHPVLWRDWQQFLSNWQEKNHLPKEWLSWGLWRWKKLPKKIFDLACEVGVNLDYDKQTQKQPGNWDLSFRLFEGFATCKTGDLNVDGTFDTPINLERLIQFWQIFGQLDYNSDLGLLNIVTDNQTSVTISADGAVSISGKTADKIIPDLSKLISEVFRSEECTGCKVCISHCPTKAISLNDAINQIEIDEELCTQCEDCHYHCPVIKFGHNEIEDLLQGLK